MFVIIMMDIDKEALSEDSFETFDDKSTNSQRFNTSLLLYVCTFCDASFSERSNWRNHISDHRKDFVCNFCGKVISQQNIESHKSICTIPLKSEAYPEKKDYFYCNTCDFFSVSKTTLKIHLKKHNSYYCRKCGGIFDHKEELQNHMFLHKSRCRFCKIDFKNVYERNEHKRKVHKFMCKYATWKKSVNFSCNQTFNNADELREHELEDEQKKMGAWIERCKRKGNIKDNKKKFPCTFLCGYIANHKSNLDRHLETCINNPNSPRALKKTKCEKCEIHFKTEAGLSMHLKSRKHKIKETVYICVCGYKPPNVKDTLRYKYLKEHIRVCSEAKQQNHTSIDENTISQSEQSEEPSNLFIFF